MFSSSMTRWNAVKRKTAVFTENLRVLGSIPSLGTFFMSFSVSDPENTHYTIYNPLRDIASDTVYVRHTKARTNGILRGRKKRLALP